MIKNSILKIVSSIFLLILMNTFSGISQTKQIDVISSGGGKTENSQYKNFGTIGQPSAGNSSNSSYKNKEGFLNGQSANVPTAVTNSVINIYEEYATINGEITFHGGAEVTSSGIIYSQSANAEIGDNGVTVVYTNPFVEDGTFSITIDGLTNGETYYARAFAENEAGYGYGADISFVSVPTLGEWGMIALATLLAGFGGMFIWRRVV